MKTIEPPSLEAFLPDSSEESGLLGREAAAADPEVAAKAAVEARMGLQRFIKSLDFKPGEPVDYSAAIEKPLQAIAKRAQEIEGRKDREHELQSLKQHAHQLITWPQYFSKVTPESTSQSEPANEYVAWKRRMATSRRENLRAGLVQLSYRKAAQEHTVVHHARQKQREREKLVNAPQREDEQLTNPTIREAVRTFQTGNAVPDPNREARIAASAARVKAKEIQREERRRDALHTLYMHAREFIVTEQQLDDKIDEIFTDAPHKEHIHDTNIWTALGAPVTVANMLAEVNNTEKAATKFHSNGALRAGKRLTKMAEELTGGKIE